MSDFSIERILSPQLGHRPPAMHYLPEHQGLPAVYGLDSRCLRPPAPVPVGLLPYGVMSFAERFYPCSAGFHPADFTGVYPNSGVCVHISSQEPTGTLLSKVRCLKCEMKVKSVLCLTLIEFYWLILYIFLDVKQLAHYQLPTRYHPTGLPQVRQKARIRTVFTDSQTQQLEALFEQTDYPAVEARAEVARVTGLSEETVRVSLGGGNTESLAVVLTVKLYFFCIVFCNKIM